MAIKPVVGMLRRNLIMDITIALTLGGGMATWFWHGFHMRNVHKRDNLYARLEQERAAEKA